MASDVITGIIWFQLGTDFSGFETNLVGMLQTVQSEPERELSHVDRRGVRVVRCESEGGSVGGGGDIFLIFASWKQCQ